MIFIFDCVILQTSHCHVLEHEFAYVGFQVLVVFPVSIPNSTHFGRGTNCLDFSGDFGSTGSQAPLKVFTCYENDGPLHCVAYEQ